MYVKLEAEYSILGIQDMLGIHACFTFWVYMLGMQYMLVIHIGIHDIFSIHAQYSCLMFFIYKP